MRSFVPPKLFAVVAMLPCALFANFSTAASASKPVLWPQDVSDLKPDPALKFGVLPNGMRYVIMHNNTPTDTVSLRFRFTTGSMQENDAQQGIAHLLEHMAFRGSKHVADGDVVKMLERIGLKFGADTNAFTSNTQTVYKFDLPNATDDNIDTGLMLMRETASELNITDEALKTERGVVLSEMRLRDTAEMRAGISELAALTPGMRATTRWPIGKAEILEKVDAKTVRSYYASFYHPERATLIVIGNVDAAKIEKKITAKFSDWAPKKKSDADPDFGKLQPVDHEAHVFVEPSLSASISMSFAKAYDAAPDTSSKEHEDFLRSAALVALNQRFQQASLADNAPFTSAESSYFGNLFNSISGTQISINTTPEKWQAGIQAVQQIVNSATTQGLRQDEVDRAVAMIRTSMQTAVAGSSTRRTPDLANSLVTALENNEVYVSPQQNLDLAEAVFKDLKATAATTALRNAFTGTNNMVFMTSNKPIEGGDAALTTAYKQALTASGKEELTQAVVTWPYTHFGEKGKIEKQSVLKDLDSTIVQFKNGVVLAVKHTTYTAGQVDVLLRVGDGRMSLKKSGDNPNYMLSALVTGGLDKIDFSTIQQALAGKSFKIEPSLNESAITLHGATTPTDLEVQLQVLTGYISEPALRSGAYEQLRNMWVDNLPLIDAQPLYSLMNKAPSLLHSNDARWTWPSVQQVKEAKRDDLKSWLDAQLKQGSVQVAIVGDIDVQRAIDLVATTLGALPSRPAAKLKLAPAGDVKFPAATATAITMMHTGSKNQAQAFLAWPATDSRANLAETADLQVLSNIIQARMIDAMRSKTGASYSANVRFEGSWQFTGYGNLAVTSDTKPEQTQVFFDAVNEIADSLRKDIVSADEFSRAQLPMLANISKQRQNNEFWSRSLLSPDVDPAYVEWVRTQDALIKVVTPERVHAAAIKYLASDKAFKVVMMPTAGDSK